MISTGQIALIISFGSLAIAAISLGWNIYRDVIRKPKLRISMMNGVIASSVVQYPRLIVSVTNFGPGKTRTGTLQLRKTSLLRRLLRRQMYAVLTTDYEDPLSGKLPVELDVGEKVALTFRPGKDLFILSDDFTQIGISDPFGGVHWCSCRHYRDVKRSYLKHNLTEPVVAPDAQAPR